MNVTWSAGIIAAVVGLVFIPAGLRAEPGASPTPVLGPAIDDIQLLGIDAVDTKIAVVAFDALGIDDELVVRLETLFRNEIDRLSSHPVPSRRAMEEAIGTSQSLRNCAGQNRCLAGIARAMNCDVAVSGNVASLGDSYAVTIKVVDAKTGELVRRIASDPLRGDPDRLIEAVRQAAYELLAPEQLVGSIMILSDLVGAEVRVNGAEVGKTPLAKPIYKLSLGKHEIEVVAAGYRPYRDTVEVRFQKTTRVVVRMVSREPVLVDVGDTGPRPAPVPWYSSGWLYAGVGVVALALGGAVGYSLAGNTIVCRGVMEQCK